MLWRKAWLECRSRVMLCLLLSASISFSVLVQLPDSAKRELLGEGGDAGAKAFKLVFTGLGMVVGPLGALILAGSGINTQTSWGATQGFHPSMYFLLSLPVTRERLLRVRALAGLGLTALWLSVSVGVLALAAWMLKLPLDPGQALATLPNLLVGTTLFYFLAVFCSAFLDEMWAGFVSLLITGLLSGYGLAGGPTWFNTMGFMMQQSLVALEPMAWLRGLIYLAVCGALYGAAWYVVEHKEY